jgi:hypothetical protein
MIVVTSPLSLGRLLWWYGEDTLWERALELTPEAVADIGERAGFLALRPTVADQIWVNRPRSDWPVLLAAIEAIEGHGRPAARRRRRATKGMPERLAVSEAERWNDPQLRAVAAIVDERNRRRGRSDTK